MTETAKNEAPLTWTSKSEWGSVGNTHRASITLDNGDRWSFTVDQPRKGYWTARGWRADRDTTGSGDMVFYREDRTMKGAKAQVQAQANLAQTSTCAECRKIAGHKLDCSTGRALAAEAMKGQRLTLRSTAAYVDQYGAGPDAVKPLPQRTPADAIRSVTAAFAAMAPVVQRAAQGFRGSVWNALKRPAGCSCPTPTHRMSCGHGARPVVVKRTPIILVDEGAQLLADANGAPVLDATGETIRKAGA